MPENLSNLADKIHSCKKCPRLVEFRESVLKDSKKFEGEVFWRKPVSGFGDINGKIMIIGLAPAASGANRTGRPFTGDKSSEFLVSCLHEAGITTQPDSVSKEDGLAYTDSFITLAVKCVPPDNRPDNIEIKNCLPYLCSEMEMMKNLKTVIVLGGLAFNSLLSCLKSKGIETGNVKFSNGGEYDFNGLKVFCVYHPSPRNVNTGRITREKFMEIIIKAVNSP
ncbi:MAG: uracil-DNA glycosylase [Candidatus Thermoplasmatota archaeon]|jgi:uracil-DNA glycosylase family 4|nr:uracil-DNA glycosylase [Candidatus Thermoplasmatota archaeon]MCL5988321.1 uracil-DNA glycosylase [Candidatus Thermoplasmatota archaeon]